MLGSKSSHILFPCCDDNATSSFRIFKHVTHSFINLSVPCHLIQFLLSKHLL
uniref:Uncharacterized protein n=1 Tax=Arundo donax TaxID=35708 RepID=A0A0A9GFA5_ARUDO